MYYQKKCSCGYSSWINTSTGWEYCPECGKKYTDNLTKICSNVHVKEKLDWIEYSSKKATKKQIAQGLQESDGRVYTYTNKMTGKTSQKLYEVMTEKGYRLFKKNKYLQFGLYVEYDPSIEMLVLLQVVLEEKEDGKFHWVETGRSWLCNKNKKFYSTINDYDYRRRTFVNLYPGYYIKENSVPNFGELFINEIADDNYSDFIEQAQSLLPENLAAHVAGNKILHINSPRTFCEYMNYKPKNKKRGGPKQTKIDELTAIPLKKITSIPEIKTTRALDVITNNRNRTETNMDRFAVIEKLDRETPTCVLRTFACVAEEDRVEEGYRLYAEGKDVYICDNTNNGWLYKPMYNDPSAWDFSMAEFDRECTKGTILQYFAEVIDEILPEYRSKAIWVFIKYPLFEQMYKSGYKNLVNFVLERTKDGKPDFTLFSLFACSFKGKDLYKKLGVNKYQLDKIESRVESFKDIIAANDDIMFPGTIRIIKAIMNENSSRFSRTVTKEQKENTISIADMDNNTFDTLLNACWELYTTFAKKHSSYRLANIMYFAIDCMHIIHDLWGMPTLLSTIPEIIENATNTDECHNYYGFIGEYYDYLYMVQQIEDTRNFRPRIYTIDHIRQMHDIATSVYQMKKNKIERSKWDKAVINAKKWEYSDGDYKAVAPVEPEELAKEGSALCHCVKSYIPRVANKETNIMFVRKEDEPDIPFFTVEISNQGYLEQVHGFSNRNVDTEPVLIPFIKKWCKERNLKQNNFDKIR